VGKILEQISPDEIAKFAVPICVVIGMPFDYGQSYNLAYLLLA